MHDLSNSLTAMSGWLAAAKESPELATEAVNRADAILKGAFRTARHALGVELPAVPPRAVGEVLDEVTEAFGPEARSRRVRITSTASTEARQAKVDAELLLPVLGNLVLNAIQHSGENAVVSASVIDLGESLEIRVSDEGPGLQIVPSEGRGRRSGDTGSKEEDAVHSSAPPSSEIRSGGAGVGLQHAYEFTRRAGGSITIVPAIRGALFLVRWPKISRSNQTAGARHPGLPGRPPIRRTSPPRGMPQSEAPSSLAASSVERDSSGQPRDTERTAGTERSGGVERIAAIDPPVAVAPSSRSARRISSVPPPSLRGPASFAAPPSSGAMSSSAPPPSSSELPSSRQTRKAALVGMRVLVVEDDPEIALLLKSLLNARGAEIHVAVNVEQLKREIESYCFDAVLFDLSPIQADVGGAVSMVHEANPLGQILIISGTVESLPSIPPHIPLKWVHKPFEVHDVVRVLMRSLNDD